MRSPRIITVLTVIIFMRNHISDLTKCSLLIQAHRNFFGTSLLVSDRGGVRVKRPSWWFSALLKAQQLGIEKVTDSDSGLPDTGGPHRESNQYQLV